MNLNRAEALFARINFLDGLPKERCREVFERSRVQEFTAGRRIIDRDDDARDVIFILHGTARVFDSTKEGREITYAEIQAGCHVGELAAIDRGPRSANVIAATDCLVAKITATEFRTLLQDCPELAARLLSDFARVIRQADIRITELCTMGAVERLCRELLQRATQLDGQTPFIDQLPTQQILASAIGSTRETVAKTMAGFKQTGLTRRIGRRLYLVDIEKLEFMAGHHSRRR